MEKFYKVCKIIVKSPDTVLSSRCREDKKLYEDVLAVCKLFLGKTKKSKRLEAVPWNPIKQARIKALTDEFNRCFSKNGLSSECATYKKEVFEAIERL